MTAHALHSPDRLESEGQGEEAEDAHDDRVAERGVGLPAHGIDHGSHGGEGQQAERPVVTPPDAGVERVDEERAAVESELSHGPAKEVEIAPAPAGEGGEPQPGQEEGGEEVWLRPAADAQCRCSECPDGRSPHRGSDLHE